MTTPDDNPRWVAALVTALPVVLAALWVWSAAPASRPAPESFAPAAVVASTAAAEPEQPARTP